ncbi:hypothetical protein [Bifidobacterium aquikefiricola]|uniref:Uncharacterized protein n=1 Tax=Bifidobacterium aquikefiricola TaxID=3059038 RepID=A0AB39U8H4_9BIFI
MLFTYLYIATMFILTLVGVGVIIWFAMKYRPKYSASTALRNLQKEQLRYHHADQVLPTDDDWKVQPHRLSEEELDSEIALLTTLNENSRSLGILAKRTLYSFIALLALLCASFAPNTIGPRLAILAVTLLCACAFAFLGIMPIARIVRNNVRLSRQFEQWAESHPQYCTPQRKAPSRKASPSDEGTTSQVAW